MAPTHRVYIDYLQVPAPDLKPLAAPGHRVSLYVQTGSGLGRRARAAAATHPDATVHGIDENSPDIVEFRLVHDLGRDAARHPDDRFTVLSHDHRHDALIAHLRRQGTDALRLAAVADVHAERPPKGAPARPPVPVPPRYLRQKQRRLPKRAEAVLERLRADLRDNPTGRPKTGAKLANWLATQLRHTEFSGHQTAFAQELRRRGIVHDVGARVTYCFNARGEDPSRDTTADRAATRDRHRSATGTRWPRLAALTAALRRRLPRPAGPA